MIVFLTSFSYPSRHAHPIHGLQMAESLARTEKNFLFVCGSAPAGFAFGTIPVRMPFKSVLTLLRVLHLRAVFFALWTVSFSRAHGTNENPVTVLLIDPTLAALLARVQRFGHYRIAFEAHQRFPAHKEAQIYAAARWVFFITRALRRAVIASHPGVEAKSQVLPSGVNLAAFDAVKESREQLRKECHLPGGNLVGYIGRFTPLGIDKGVRRLIDAVPYFPKNTSLMLVGGTKEEVEQEMEHAEAIGVKSRVHFVEHVQPERVPYYAKACDLLAYVPHGGVAFFETETSPMKLFEYMAAGRAILATSVPTFTEVLDDATSYLISPDVSSEELGTTVGKALGDPARDTKATRAHERAAEFAWPGRIARMLSALAA